MPRKTRIAIASVFALAALSAIAPAASANIYWSNAGNSTIGRANDSGAAANQTFITGASTNSTALAIGSNYIYWTNLTGTIGRANLDGTNPNQSFITGASDPNGLATDGNYIYWSNVSGTIGRANLDGTGVNQSFITGAGDPYGVAINGDYIYWTNGSGNAIGRANLDGTSANATWISLSTRPYGIVAGGNYLYWANLLTGTIGRANLDGTGANQSFITGASSPRGVVVDDTYIYWANSGGNTIGRASLDGTGVSQSFISGANQPYGLAVDTFNAVGSLSPLSHDYGNRLLSAGPTAAATFTLSSAGSANLFIRSGGISLTGTGSDQFQITGGTCIAGQSSLPSGQSCTVAVTFFPFQVGSKSANLEIRTNAGTKSSALTGIGTVASPSIRGVGKPNKRSIKVEVGCGDAASCILRLTGNKIGTNALLVPETISISAGTKKTVTLVSTGALEKALAKGGRVEVTATNTSSGTLRTVAIKVPR